MNWKQKLFDLMPYKIKRMTRDGVRVYIYCTFRCNLKCEYCTIEYRGKWPICEEIGIEEWKRIIDTWVDVKEVVITGGEPGLYKDIVELANYILDKGYLLIINTNLMTKRLVDIKKNRNLMLYISKHVMTEKQIKTWDDNYDWYWPRHRVRVDVLDKTKSIIDRVEVEKICYPRLALSYSPSGVLYTRFGDLFEACTGGAI